MASQYLSQFASPAAKLVRFFKKSRDGWKAKYQDSSKRHKKTENQRRAVEKSRAVWRARAEASEKRVTELELEIEQLKFGGSCPANPW